MAEETQEELMERVKKMSPEELLEFQKSRCIFCQIIAGKVQSKKIYDDGKVFAILDINPANPGHILLMPKEHYAIMPQVPDNIIAHLAFISKKLSQIALQTLGAKGTNIIVQNGVAAGQRAQHFMLHIIPRKEGDGLPIGIERKTISENDYNVVKDRLKKKVNEIFGIKEEKIEEAQVVEKKEEKKEKKQDDKNEKIEEANIVQEKISNVEEANKIVEETNKEIDELKDAVKEEIEEHTFMQEKVITSEQAKRYHQINCAFAQNIPVEKRITLSVEDAEAQGKKPCTCVSGKRIPLDKDEERTKERKNTEKDEDSEDKNVDDENIDDSKEAKDNDDTSANLDDIARIFTGR